jgi:hypothetical protein
VTEQELNEIESRANAATPGPWHLNSADGGYTVCTGPEDDTEGPHECIASIFDSADDSDFKNAVFCAHAREDVPALIDEVRRLRAEAEKNRRVFVWEMDKYEQAAFVLSESLAFYIVSVYRGFVLTLTETDTGEELWAWGMDSGTMDAAEQLIRELGFARDGDTFDRSKVEK